MQIGENRGERKERVERWKSMVPGVRTMGQSRINGSQPDLDFPDISTSYSTMLAYCLKLS